MHLSETFKMDDLLITAYLVSLFSIVKLVPFFLVCLFCSKFQLKVYGFLTYCNCTQLKDFMKQLLSASMAVTYGCCLFAFPKIWLSIFG